MKIDIHAKSSEDYKVDRRKPVLAVSISLLAKMAIR
jgi:hypothetical protein